MVGEAATFPLSSGCSSEAPCTTAVYQLEGGRGALITAGAQQLGGACSVPTVGVAGGTDTLSIGPRMLLDCRVAATNQVPGPDPAFQAVYIS